MLMLHRSLLELRRTTASLAVGSYRRVYTDDNVLVYEREAGGQRRRVALNLSGSPREVAWSGPRGRILLSTHLDRSDEGVAGRLKLRADEGVVFHV